MVNILKKIEDNLGKLVEGVFDKTFQTPLHPVEIARKITSTIDDNITLDGTKKIAANYITIIMPADAHDRIFKITPEIIDQLKIYIMAHISEKGYQLAGTLNIEIKQGERLLVAAENVTDKAQNDNGDTLQQKPKCLIIVDMENKTQGHIDLSDYITIGRAIDSTIVISSSTASRNHADIREIDGYYVLRDLASSNGTILNGKNINASRLKVGDEILIAKTTIKVI